MRRRRVKVALLAHNFDRAGPLRRPPDLIRGDEAIRPPRGDGGRRRLASSASSRRVAMARRVGLIENRSNNFFSNHDYTCNLFEIFIDIQEFQCGRVIESSHRTGAYIKGSCCVAAVSAPRFG
jgi:hypothetical protein